MSAPSSLPDSTRTTIYSRLYIDLKIPSSVTPPAPVDKNTIPFTSADGSAVNKTFFNQVVLQKSYGADEMCGYSNVMKLVMVECARPSLGVFAIVCQY